MPADSSRPLEERKHDMGCDLTKDSFVAECQNYFSQCTASVDTDLLKNQIISHAKERGQEVQTISDELLSQLMKVSSLDIFPALLPTKDTGFVGVSVYLDDKGVSKGLPRNDRLSSLLQHAGYSDQLFYGDAFVARVYDDGDEKWERQSFLGSEFALDADWVGVSREQRKKPPAPKSVDVGPMTRQQRIAALKARCRGA